MHFSTLYSKTISFEKYQKRHEHIKAFNPSDTDTLYDSWTKVSVRAYNELSQGWGTFKWAPSLLLALFLPLSVNPYPVLRQTSGSSGFLRPSIKANFLPAPTERQHQKWKTFSAPDSFFQRKKSTTPEETTSSLRSLTKCPTFFQRGFFSKESLGFGFSCLFDSHIRSSRKFRARGDKNKMSLTPKNRSLDKRSTRKSVVKGWRSAEQQRIFSLDNYEWVGVPNVLIVLSLRGWLTVVT